MNSMNMGFVHLISVNIRGLRNKEKRKMIYNWITNQKADICFLQETFLDTILDNSMKKEWSIETISSFGTNHSRGVTIAYKKNVDLKIINYIVADDGRKILINLEIQSVPFTLVNLYAPTKHTERELFFKKTIFWLKRNVKNPLLIGGDLNCVQNKSMDSKNIKSTNNESKSLNKIIKYFKLVDIWRNFWPDKKQYTWRQISLNLFSRIDYWLIQKDLIKYVEATDIRPTIKTDHNAISLKLKLTESKRGPGFWKFNAALLTDEMYKTQIKDIILNCKHDCKQLSKQLSWEFCKRRIKDFSIKYSQKKSKVRKDIIKELEKDVEDIEKQVDDKNTKAHKKEYIEAKSKLERLYKEITKGSIIRSRVKWFEEGESNSKYFIGLEKHNAIKNSITQLKLEKGKLLTDMDSILNATVEYYTNLYKSKKIKDNDIDVYIDKTEVEILSHEDAIKCEGLLTIDECTNAVKELKSNRSPGMDGLTPEFYKCFWSEIKEMVIDSLNEGFAKGSLSFSQRRGIINLLYKKGDKNNLDNYRPITLLNYDYKICTAVLSIRVQNVLKNIISEEQCGYVKGRFIGQNIRVIEDVINYCNGTDNECAILFIDFQKAFDSLEINFLMKCLKRFGFHSQFLSWVKAIYTDIDSCISMNGWLSRSLELEKGIRQGCPLSALLFIMATQILSSNVKNNVKIKGVTFKEEPDLEIKIVQLADDTTIFVNDMESVNYVIKTIEKFSLLSGIYINKYKTEGMWLGKNKPPNLNKEITWTEGPVKCLGLYFGKDKNIIESLNWNTKITKLQKTLNNWKARRLTYYGKITIIKTLGISTIMYNASNLNVPEHIIKKVNRQIFTFLWGSDREKVKRNTTTDNMESGGLKMLNLENQIYALKIKWIARILDETDEHAIWKRIAKLWFKKLGGLSFILELNCQVKDIKDIIYGDLPLFYQDILKAWYTLQSKTETNTSVNRNTILWGNTNIRHKNKVLFFKEWIKTGIIHMKDIIVNNRFLNVNEVSQIIKNPLNMFMLHKLINAIPKAWKNEVRSNSLSSNKRKPSTLFKIQNRSKTFEHISILGTKEIYNLLNTDIEKPMCIQYWEKHGIFVKEWDKIFLFKIKNRLENRIGQFQFNVLYNLIPCKHNLNKWNISDTHACGFCKQKDNLEHFFMCPNNKLFWSKMLRFICQMEKCPLFEMNLKIIICGWDIDSTQKQLANILIIYACFSIYKSRIIHNDSGRIIPIQILFTEEIKRIDQILSNSKRKLRIPIDKDKWNYCKVFWNVVNQDL